LAAILGAVGGTLIVIVIAIVGVMLVLIVAKRRKPQHLDTNKEGIRMDFVHA
jgi:multisubunit Na+/H+ antiporter MnhC subunit